MSGLFERAKSLRNQYSDESDIELDLSPLADISDIPEEEKNSILSWIERNIEKGRDKLQDESFVFKLGKKGILMPFIVNLAGILFIAAGVYFFYFFYTAEQETLVSGTNTSLVAQSRIIQVLKEEAEKKLSEKEREISDVQQKLTAVNREREELKANMDSQLLEREQELQQAYAADMETLRSRLQSEGASEEDISKQIEELEAKNKLALDQTLSALQSEMDEQFREQEEEILAREEEYRKSLESAQLEFSQLEQQATAREAELETERSEAFAEVERIRGRQEQERAVLNQIRTFYQRITSSITAGRFPEAIVHIEALEDYLLRDDIDSLAGMKEQVQSDMSVLKSMKSMVTIFNSQDQIVPEEIAETAVAEFVLRIDADVESADALYDSGETQKASTAYLAALSAIESLNKSHERLESLLNDEWERRYRAETDRLAAVITEWQSKYRNDAAAFQARIADFESKIKTDTTRYDTEIEKLSAKVLEQEIAYNTDTGQLNMRISELQTKYQTDTEQLNAQITAWQSKYQIDTETLANRIASMQEDYAELQEQILEETNRAESVLNESKNISTSRALLLKDIVELRTRLAQTLAQTDLAAVYDQNELVRLLQTKLLIRNVLSSEPIQTEYPDLLEDMEEYFASIREEQQRETETEALRSITKDLSTIIDKHE